MSLPDFINEPILVQARFAADGAVTPTAFIWRQRTRYVTDWGRTWEEQAGGVTWRCYLVRTAAADTFELCYAPAEGRWMLTRAWVAREA
jgi:hypothetical protein